ncbi:hypothetical protein J437_LFUL014113 [Ladona fulva]|uniref:sphingomyelin phosphodiesterase n=1 Tax=Ladona fulva TaxID=123851 RepID=A0A8K0KDJ4_LADFU|nr:hypothetical protein J437_LFUL014113 [Ladona fulva]
MFYPWTTAVSFCLSCYISNILEKLYPQRKLTQYFLFGPISAILAILLLPTGVLGGLLWVLLCSFACKDKYTYCAFEGKGNEKQDLADTISENPENLGEFFPLVDFFCFQEVWERFQASMLMKTLSKEYDYFIYDVGVYDLKTNLCMFGSGLMFASKKPILEADFKAFSLRTKHAKFVSLGVLCVKVLLGYGRNGIRYVGYISNLHTQAFQGTDPVIYSQLTETMAFAEKFKENNSQAGDIVKFDVMCGDFNADNMSPDYTDVCVEKPGKDHPWAIGTELRQMMLFNPEISTPEQFKEALIDDSLRRMYVLDADVMVHHQSLMTSIAKPDSNGVIKALPYGGMRRVDKILINNSVKVNILGYGFISALTHLTDHIPVCMTVKTVSA